ncbi:MAG: hypothetical protein ACOX9B_01980 [Candidatus Xenobium sp.]|jgi:hypothetical protein|nr:hypothetical protein [Burkholderiales bacterium]
MSRLILAWILLTCCWGCSPQASGPPQPAGGGVPLSSQTLTPPQETATPYQTPDASTVRKSETFPDLAEVSQELTGTIVEVQEAEIFLTRPSGVELRFRLPQDIRLHPEGKSVRDLTPGAEVLVRLRTVERGMEAAEIHFLEGR